MGAGKRRARNLLLIAVVLGFLGMGSALAWLGNDLLRQQALRVAEEEARIILERNLAIHSYFAHQLKPKVFDLAQKASDPDYFEPAWMSSTFAIRGIDQHYQALTKGGYYYKECAINARSPQNEADAYERAFIEQMKADPQLMQRSDIRILEGQPFFVHLRRGESMEASCLRCHSQPEQAPGAMVALYGAERSFNRQEGELVSAISIRVPLTEALAWQGRFAGKLGLLLLLGLGMTITVILFLHRALFQRPLDDMRRQARAIAEDPARLGQEIPPQPTREWDDLARDFNRMSASLKASHEQQEEMVRQRTAQLAAKTRDLEQSLATVQQLSGLLPICAHCKKIRDDKGYWHKIERYISQRSLAEFSHGICPDCAKLLYAELLDGEDDPGNPSG